LGEGSYSWLIDLYSEREQDGGDGVPAADALTSPLSGLCLIIIFFTRVTDPRRSLSPKLSDARVYAPQTRARLGTTAQFCKVIIRRRTVVTACPLLTPYTLHPTPYTLHSTPYTLTAHVGEQVLGGALSDVRGNHVRPVQDGGDGVPAADALLARHPRRDLHAPPQGSLLATHIVVLI